MKMMRTHVSLVLAVAVVVVGVVVSPLAALAAPADITLYELNENMSFAAMMGSTHRLATSALGGYAFPRPGHPICDSPSLQTNGVCVMNAMATDNIDLNTGKGPVAGSFTVVTQDANPIDQAEEVKRRGEFKGMIDLSCAIGACPFPWNGFPIGTIAGTMKRADAPPTFPFKGVFRLPFLASCDGSPSCGGTVFDARSSVCPATPAPNPKPFLGGLDVAYVDTDSNAVPNGSCLDVTEAELALLTPTVRLDIFFRP